MPLSKPSMLQDVEEIRIYELSSIKRVAVFLRKRNKY